MIKALFFAFAVAGASLAHSETISVGQQAAQSDIKVPRSGLSMDQVRQQFGDPQESRGPVGQPPISVWSYGQFTVYFEGQTVIHTVLHKPAS